MKTNTGFELSRRSATRLNGVHPLLAAVVVLAMHQFTTVDFGVAKDCVRTLERQREMVDSGVSKTMNSYHLIQDDSYSHAVDLYPSGYSDINDIHDEAWHAVASAMELAAGLLGVKVNWGYAMWGWDKPHFQIEI